MRAMRIALLSLLSSLALVVGACDSGGSDGDQSNSSESETDTSGAAQAKMDKKGEQGEMPFEATGPVAKVNDHKITAERYNKFVRDKIANSPRQIPPQMIGRLKKKAIDSLIDRHLISNEIEEAGISASKKEVDEAFKDMKDRFPNDKAYQAFLRSRGTSEDELKDKLKKDVKLRKLLRERKGIEVSESDAKKYYDKNPKEYEEKEKVKARHILIKNDGSSDAGTAAKQRAESIAKKAKKEGTDFAELAKKKSEGPSAKKGGDLGFFTRDRMVKEFSEKAFSMKNGEISGPVETKFGYHIIKREDHKEAKKKKFEKVKSDIIDKLERKKFREAVKKLRKTLRKEADVKKMPENIKTNASQGQQGGSGGMRIPGAGGGGAGAPPAPGGGGQGGGAVNKDLEKPEALQNEGGSEESSSGGE